MLTKLKSLWRYFTRKKPDATQPPPEPTIPPPSPNWLDGVRESAQVQSKEYERQNIEDTAGGFQTDVPRPRDPESTNPVQFFVGGKQYFYWVEEKALGFETLLNRETHVENESKFVIIRDPSKLKNDNLIEIWKRTRVFRMYHDAQYRGSDEFMKFLDELDDKFERVLKPKDNVQYEPVDNGIQEFEEIKKKYDIPEPEGAEPETEGQESNDE